MDEVKRDKIIKVMEIVMKDTQDDLSNFEGKEFNGKNVSTLFGNQGAAICAIAIAVKTILEEEKPNV